MNPIPEPDELLESECNAQGLYGLPAGAFVRDCRTDPGFDARAVGPGTTPDEHGHPASDGQAGVQSDDDE